MAETIKGFQSTFPRGERLEEERTEIRYVKISIHVPARGTTERLWLSTQQKYISIHVPARGTTCTVRVTEQHNNISIHVPARGTTVLSNLFNTEYIFQSTFPRGERQRFLCAWCRWWDFNPRSREGNDGSTCKHRIVL